MDIKILQCRKFAPPCPCEAVLRVVKDYEIDIELGDGHIACVDGKEYALKRGDICVRKPGQRVYCTGVINSVLLTLDFSGNHNAETYSRNIEGPIQQVVNNNLINDLNCVIKPVSDYTFIPIYNELLQVAHTDDDVAKYLVMELLHKLNAEQYRLSYVKNNTKETVTGKVFRYMKEHLGENVTLEKLAEFVHLEKNYLVRIFKSDYGHSPIKMLISMRMEHAHDLVVNTDMPITEISCLCGYSSPSYFTAEYKKYFGETPLNQRRK